MFWREYKERDEKSSAAPTFNTNTAAQAKNTARQQSTVTAKAPNVESGCKSKSYKLKSNK